METKPKKTLSEEQIKKMQLGFLNYQFYLVVVEELPIKNGKARRG